MLGKLKVLYVVGNGRSGSTVFDTILGTARSAVSAGQLSSVSNRHMEKCSCGETADRCQFWSRVFSLYEEETGDYGRKRLQQLEQRFDSDTRLPRFLLGDYRKEELSEFYRLTTTMLRSVKQISDKDWIIDSSKLVTRALHLSRMPEIELVTVQLIRDGRGVLWSAIPRHLREAFSRGDRAFIVPPRKIVRQISRRWRRVNLSIQMLQLAGLMKRPIVVKYENLTRNPIAEIERLENLIGLQMSESKQFIAENRPFKILHILSGNPELRSVGSFTIDPSVHEKWHDAYPRALLLRHYLECLPVHLIFGYPPIPGERKD